MTPPLPPEATLDLGDRGATRVYTQGPEGAGPTVLLLHGINGGAGINFWGLYPHLDAAQLRVVAPDQRGHGLGPRGPRPTVTDLADDAAAVLDALDARSAIVVGYSMGGAVAQEMWHRHPDRVEGLVLCATAARFSHGTARRRFYSLAPRVARVVDRAGATAGRLLRLDELSRLPGDVARWVNAEVARHDPRAIASLSRSLGAFDARPWLSAVDVPHAVVVTAGDRVVPPDRQRELAACLPAAMTVEVSAGHSTIMVRPATVAPALVEAIEAVIG